MKEIKNSHPTLSLRDPSCLIVTWFGAGFSPFAPGTAGSLAALPFAYLIQHWLGHWGLLGAALGLFFIGWKACDIYLKKLGSQDDRSEIVVDEVAGQWLLLSFLAPTWQGFLAGFLLFRLFDVIKPWPICIVDRNTHNGLGVMADDAMAGIYPILLLALALLICGVIGAPADSAAEILRRLLHP